MEKRKNNSKGLLVVTIILAIALIASGGYITYTEFFTKRENNKTEEKSDNSVIVISDEEKVKILERIADINNYNLGMYDNLDMSKVSNQEKLAFVSFIVYNNKLNGEEGSIVGLSGKKVTEIYQSYFGTNSSITNEDIKMGVDNTEIIFKYNKDKDIYEKTGLSHYMAPAAYLITTPSTFFVEGNKSNDKYTIKVKSLFNTPCNDVCGPGIIAGSYKDASDGKEIEGTDSWYDGEILIKEEITNSDYEQVKDKIPTYTYTFTLVNGNYIFQNKTISK